MTPKDPFFGGDFLGQILVAPSLPGTFVYSRAIFTLEISLENGPSRKVPLIGS